MNLGLCCCFLILVIPRGVRATRRAVCDPKTKNVLLIVIDDMRPEFGAMEGEMYPVSVHPQLNTPNIDKLASRSMLFRKAYAQSTSSAPSRTSFLTGRRPSSTHQFDFEPARPQGANFTTLPGYFKDNCYRSTGFGKVFHQTKYDQFGEESDFSFSERNYWPHIGYFWNVLQSMERSWMAVTEEMRGQNGFPDLLVDEDVRDMTLKKLGQHAKGGAFEKQKFFIAVGFHKPRSPFIFPSKFLDLYPEDEIEMPKFTELPTKYPSEAWFDYPALRRSRQLKEAGVTGLLNSSIPQAMTRQLRRAYYASISYIDELIGNLVDELESLDLANDTVVALVSDHGYSLGESGLWASRTLRDVVTRSVMSIRVPGVTEHGVVNDNLVELVDLFPTIVDAAGLPAVPLCEEDNWETKVCHEGSSLLPLLKEPATAQPSKTRVFSQQAVKGYTLMGNSMTTPQYRYTEYVPMTRSVSGPHRWQVSWQDVDAKELYDHNVDPDETNNLADEADDELLQRMSSMLHAGWRETLKDSSDPEDWPC